METSHINLTIELSPKNIHMNLTTTSNHKTSILSPKPINSTHVIIFSIGFLIVLMSLGLVFCLVFQYFYVEYRDKKLREKIKRRRQRKINTMLRKNPALFGSRHSSGCYDVTPLTWSTNHGLRVNTRALKNPYAYHPISIEIEEADDPAQQYDEDFDDPLLIDDESSDDAEDDNDDDKSQVGDVIKPIVKFSRYTEVNRTRWNLMRTPKKSSLRSIVQQASALNAAMAEQAALSAINSGNNGAGNFPTDKAKREKPDKEIVRAIDDDDQENAAQQNQNVGNNSENQAAVCNVNCQNPNQVRTMVREPTMAEDGSSSDYGDDQLEEMDHQFELNEMREDQNAGDEMHPGLDLDSESGGVSGSDDDGYDDDYAFYMIR